MHAYSGREMTFMATLRAGAGTATLPGPTGPVSTPVWGFHELSAPEAVPQVPGPVLEARQGGLVRVSLENGLSEPVSIAFPGQELTPQPVKDASGRFLSYTNPAEPGGEPVIYSFRAARPGTFLYESGTRPETQVAMGLYGVFIVRPWDFNPNRASTRTAYGYGTGYDVEQVLVLADVDTRLNRAVAGGTPFDLAEYAPDHWTINGRSYPGTLAPDDASSQPYGASITARRGQTVLLRLANAGFRPHSLCFGGLFVRVIGADGYPLRTSWQDKSYQKTTLTIAAGETYDVLLRPGAPGEYYLYDRALLHSLGAGEFPGGMITRLTVT